MTRSGGPRVTLIEHVVSERLSAPAIDLLFDHADVLSEGNGAQVGVGGTFFGSTMLTISLEALAEEVAEPVAPEIVGRLRDLCEMDTRVRRRLVDLVRQEASRQCGGAEVDACDVDIALRADGLKLLMDLDIEARVAAPRTGERSAA